MDLPLLIEPEQLNQVLGDEKLLIVDLCNPQSYNTGHIPGAAYVAPGEMVCGIPPAPGKIAPTSQLEVLFSRLGSDS